MSPVEIGSRLTLSADSGRGGFYGAFFTWAAAQYEAMRERRCPLRSAVGYAMRQREPLLRMLQDGRLPLERKASDPAGVPASGAWRHAGLRSSHLLNAIWTSAAPNR